MLISNILKQVPPAWRRKLIGRHDHPSRIATIVHRILNRMSEGNSQSDACSGALAGYRMYVDWGQFRSFVYDSWEPTVVSRALSEIRTGMTVVDVGAHHGYYTLLFSKYVGPTGLVISFEQDADRAAPFRSQSGRASGSRPPGQHGIRCRVDRALGVDESRFCVTSSRGAFRHKIVR